MIERTLAQLKTLRLSGMANALTSQIEQPGTYEALSFEERLQLLTDSEDQNRDQRQQARLLKNAQFEVVAHSRDIDYEHPRGVKAIKNGDSPVCYWRSYSRKPMALTAKPCKH